MPARTLSRRARHLVAAFATLAGASPAFAQAPPAAFPLTVPAAVSEQPIEIYYGTTKVSPTPAAPVAPPQPQDMGPVVPASAKGGPAYLDNRRSAEALADTLHSVRDGTRDITAAAVGVLGKVGDRVKHTAESRQIVLASYSMPMPSISMPVQQAPATPAAPAQPQIVVMREPGESRSAPSESPRGLTLSIETLVAGGIGILGLLFALMAWARGSRKNAMAPVVIQTSSAQIDPNSIQLMGKYNAGPVRETAEKFEIGPSYHDELKQKKHVEESNNAAAVEFILNQNLALLAALNPEAAGTMVHTDAEGFAIPAETTIPAMA